MSAALEIIKDHYAASARGDLDGMLKCLADDVSWTEMAGFPYAGTYIGPDAVRRNVFERIGAEWDDYSADPDELIDGPGDVIVAVGNYSGTYKKTGKFMRVRVVHIWRLRDGAVVNFEQFTDTRLVAEAMS